MFSGPTSVRRASERDVVLRLAWSMSKSAPEAVFRNPEKLARGWKLQEEDRQRFIGFFGFDVVVLPTREVEQRMVDYYSSAEREARPDGGNDVQAPRTPLPPELDDCETVGLIYDEVDALGYYTDFALAEAAFAEPELLKKRLPATRTRPSERRQHRAVRPPTPGGQRSREGELRVPAVVEASRVRLDTRWGPCSPRAATTCTRGIPGAGPAVDREADGGPAVGKVVMSSRPHSNRAVRSPAPAVPGPKDGSKPA